MGRAPTPGSSRAPTHPHRDPGELGGHSGVMRETKAATILPVPCLPSKTLVHVCVLGGTGWRAHLRLFISKPGGEGELGHLPAPCSPHSAGNRQAPSTNAASEASSSSHV